MNLTKRQKEIIDCALSIIAQSGIQALTTRNLSEKVGISEPGLYRHFKNKSAIIECIYKLFENESKSSILSILQLSDTSINQLGLIFHSRCSFFSNNPDFSAIVFSEELFRDKDELSGKIKSIMQFHRESIISIIVKGQKAGEIRNDIQADHICNIYMGLLRILVTGWRMSNFSYSLIQEGIENFESVKMLLIKK